MLWWDNGGGIAVTSTAAAAVAWLPSLLVRCFFIVFFVLLSHVYFALLLHISTSPLNFGGVVLLDFV